MPTKKKNKTTENKPIGIFDSGFGGLTVMSEIRKCLPKENLIYFGDTAHVPYGSKSKNAVINFSKDIAGFLIKKDVKLIVVACNTASAFALDNLKKNLKVPVIGVIDPGAKAAAAVTKNKNIGVIGTEGTVQSGSYLKAIKKISGYSVSQQACPLFVPLVEEGWVNNKVTDDIVRHYLKPLLKKNIDTLVLGCTHYPILKNSLQKNAGKKITLVDSAKATANEVKNILEKNKISSKNSKKGTLAFYVSDNPEKFAQIGGKFFSNKISKVTKINPERA
ncbi:glutamate racemase [Endomicrobium proavitum]|uniref:Glutamate racemase n=1 Tax=Endomicrobium proavitum TaxID=1408281 RepID=A0A0G3WHK6_9BACT|nr:glutamate racemase [Endomicrobium proavitum]AKL97385.1 Glutamate racemase [Endomicrobium proavitum]